MEHQSDRRFGILTALLLFAVVCGLYLPWMDNEFIYDDQLLILKIAAPADTSELFKVFGQQLTERDPNWPDLPYYRPVARFTYVVQKFFSGNAPGPYHAFNVVLVGLTAIFIHELLRLPVFNLNRWAALIAALVFCTHPITSVVAFPISARETILPTFFTVTAAYFYLRGGRWLIAAMISFVLALLSKELGVVIPCVFFVADVFKLTPNAPGKDWKVWAIRYVPVIVILSAYFAMRSKLFGGNSQHEIVLLEKPLGPLWTMLFTWQTTLAPFKELIYEPAREIWWSNGRVAVSVAIVLGTVVWFFKQSREVRIVGLFWLAWAAFGLLPISNILNQEAKFAERYGFLPIVGWLGMFGCVLTAMLSNPRRRNVAIAVATVAILACSWISYGRGVFFSSDMKFLEQWVKTSPNSIQANVSMAQYFVETNNAEIAEDYSRTALSLDDNISRAHNILGAALGMQGKFEEAEKECLRAIKLQPNLAEGYNNLGFVYAIQGKLPKAAESHEKATLIRPTFWEAYFNLGNVYEELGELDRSVAYFERSLELNRDYAEAHNNLGLVLEKLGRRNDAITHYRIALLLNPGLTTAAENLQRLTGF